MYKCDICSNEIKKEEMHVVPASILIAMSKVGFVPNQVGSELLATNTDRIDISKEHIWAKSISQNTTTDWGLCLSCFSELKAYEQKQQQSLIIKPCEQNKCIELLSVLSSHTQKFEILKYLQYPTVIDDLIYLLENEPDPDIQLPHQLRESIIWLLGESGDDRAIVPLLNCYMAYLAPEELFIEYWKECSVSVPETYRDIFDLIKKYGIKSLNDSAAQQRYKDAISGTVVGNVRDEDHALKMIFFAHSVRLSIVRSLSRINSVNIKGIFQRMLSREHNTVVIEELSLELGKLGDTQVIPNLVALLENPKAAQRFMTMDLVVQIIDILGNFSEHHEQAFEAITKLYEFDGEKKFLCGHQEIRDHAFALLQRFPNRQPEVEEMKKRMGWRSDGHCELCGNKVGFLDRLLGKVRCKEHQATA